MKQQLVNQNPFIAGPCILLGYKTQTNRKTRQGVLQEKGEISKMGDNTVITRTV